MDITLAQD